MADSVNWLPMQTTEAIRSLCLRHDWINCRSTDRLWSNQLRIYHPKNARHSSPWYFAPFGVLCQSALHNQSYRLPSSWVGGHVSGLVTTPYLTKPNVVVFPSRFQSTSCLSFHRKVGPGDWWTCPFHYNHVSSMSSKHFLSLPLNASGMSWKESKKCVRRCLHSQWRTVIPSMIRTHLKGHAESGLIANIGWSQSWLGYQSKSPVQEFIEDDCRSHC